MVGYGTTDSLPIIIDNTLEMQKVQRDMNEREEGGRTGVMLEQLRTSAQGVPPSAVRRCLLVLNTPRNLSKINQL